MKLEDPNWPEAAPRELISDPTSDESLTRRATSIVRHMVRLPLAGLKVLDYGCGTGHVAKAVGCLGYDPSPERWARGWWKENTTCTDDWRDVAAGAPYDVIILNDVLDHCVTEGPVEVLRRVKALSGKHTTIHVRCHPWCSRHGTHHWQVNRAYAHLVYGDLAGGQEVLKVIHPNPTYARWFRDAGLQVREERTISEPVPDYIKDMDMVIKRHWADSPDPKLKSGEEFPAVAMSIQFKDYVVTRPVS